jgi:actin-related protein 6
MLSHACRIFPNSIARSRTEKKVFVGDEVGECKDFSGVVYRRPFERGMLVDWDAERTIWDRLFSPDAMNVSCASGSSRKS